LAHVGKAHDVLSLSEIPSQIICYPRPSEDERQRRLRELENIGVDQVLLKGETTIDGYQVLGKGCVSVVIPVKAASGVAVLKIRRTDANRVNMFHEAEMLSFVNSLDIGPKLLSCTANMLLMEYIEGPILPKWLRRADQSESERVKKTVRALLKQCYTMDTMHLDHGELSNASKHVIVRSVEWSPVIIDFESASRTRRVQNLTSICQFLFMSKENSRVTQAFTEPICPESFKTRLREYKLEPSERRFQQILSACNLE